MAPPKDVTAVTSGVSPPAPAFKRPPAPRREKAVLATNEEVRGISKRVMTERIEAYKELARYDSN